MLIMSATTKIKNMRQNIINMRNKFHIVKSTKGNWIQVQMTRKGVYAFQLTTDGYRN